MRLKSLALCGMGYSSRGLVLGDVKMTLAQKLSTLADVAGKVTTGTVRGRVFWDPSDLLFLPFGGGWAM